MEKHGKNNQAKEDEQAGTIKFHHLFFFQDGFPKTASIQRISKFVSVEWWTFKVIHPNEQ